MSTHAHPAVTSIAIQPGAGEALWFLGALATVKASSEATAGRVSVTEFLAPCGHGSPLHIRKDHDQSFYVLEGELTFWLDGEIIAAPAGSYVYGPRGIPFRFTISSEEARFLLVTEPGSFEEFMRALAEPALERAIPPAASEPPDIARLAPTAAGYGIDFLGRPVPATDDRTSVPS